MRKLCLFLLLVFALDRLIGTALNYLYHWTMTGQNGGLINLALTKDADILVLGSSRARHHISPAVLGPRLSANVFNAGVNGQDFLYTVMLLDLWKRNHPTPRAVILTADPNTLVRRQEEIERASVFSAHYDDSDRVRDILLLRGKYERVKYLSYCYRFNGKVLSIFKNVLTRQDDAQNGFVGLAGNLGSARLDGREADPSITAQPFWDLKLRYLSEVAAWCRQNEIKLFLVHGPSWHADPVALRAWSGRMSTLMSQYPGVTFLDISEQTYPDVFLHSPQMFRDEDHLNAAGANLFSEILADELSRRLGPNTLAGSIPSPTAVTSSAKLGPSPPSSSFGPNALR